MWLGVSGIRRISIDIDKAIVKGDTNFQLAWKPDGRRLCENVHRMQKISQRLMGSRWIWPEEHIFYDDSMAGTYRPHRPAGVAVAGGGSVHGEAALFLQNSQPFGLSKRESVHATAPLRDGEVDRFEGKGKLRKNFYQRSAG